MAQWGNMVPMPLLLHVHVSECHLKNGYVFISILRCMVNCLHLEVRLCISFGSRTQRSDGLGCLPNQIVSHSDVLLMLRALVYAALKTVGLLGIKYSIRMKHCKEMLCVCVLTDGVR